MSFAPRFAFIALALCAAGCSKDEGAPSCGTSVVYAPLGRAIDAWPDDYWTAGDPASATGVRVHIKAGDNFDLPQVGASFGKLFDDLSLLDGFGTTSPLYLRFTGALDPTTVPPGPASANPNDVHVSAVLLDLDATGAPAPIDVEWSLQVEFIGDTNPDGMAHTLIGHPLRPLLPKRHYGVAVTTRLHAADGGCVSPSPAMASLLSENAPDGLDPALARLRPRYTRLVAALKSAGIIQSANDVVAGLVFTTQHTVDDSAAIATEIRKHAVPYLPSGACTPDGSGRYRVCEGKMSSFDYRLNHLYVDEQALTPHDAWQVPVVIYLPVAPAAAGGYPTILYGHGLGGDRHQAAALAALAAPEGYAVVAIDAVKHGDHPDQPAMTGTLGSVIEFFGLSLKGTTPLDSRRLRDNFRQSTYDKLQVVEMLRPGLDADGDGQVDVSLSPFLYLGVSLGGIMAAELLAFAPEAQVAMPIVPGARVTEIIQYAKMFQVVVNLFRSSATDGEVTRFFPLLQTAIDRGDAGAYAAHIVGDRLPGFDAASPQTLMQMVKDDDTVPNVCNGFYARALGVPLVGDELYTLGPVAHHAAPVENDLSAHLTGGVFQYDVVFQGDGPMTEPATHGNVAANPLTITQTLHFIDSWFKTGSAEIIDPYRTLGVKP